MDDGDELTHQTVATWTVHLVVVAALVATVVWRVARTGHGWFYIDDWRLAQQSESIGGIFSAYNGHLSVVILVMYRVTLEVFGFSTYLPFRILGAVCFASVGAALYFTLHRHLGRPIAFGVGALMLWPAGATVEVCALNHWLSVASGVVCAVLLWRGETRRGNVLLAVMLTFSLASADGGVAVGVACFVYVFCSRVSWKRRLAAIGPMVGWAAWWYFVGRTHTTKFPQRFGTWQIVQFVVYGIGDSAKLLTFGVSVNGWLVLVGLAILALSKARRGLGEMANVLAWSAALIFWWSGIAWFRSGGFTIFLFRYMYVGAVFMILACVPVRPVSWARLRNRLEASTLPMARTIAVVAVWSVVVVAAGFLVVDDGAPSVRASSLELNSIGSKVLATAQKVDQGPAVVPDGQNLGIQYYFLNAGEVRALFRTYGGGPPSG